jgi:hypothetical protein
MKNTAGKEEKREESIKTADGRSSGIIIAVYSLYSTIN